MLRYLPLLTLGNVYVADSYNHCIRKVTISTGIITTIAGSSPPGDNEFGYYDGGYSGDGGAATSATLNLPTDVALDSSGMMIIFIS